MGAYLNSNGQLDYRSDDSEGSAISDTVKNIGKTLAIGVGGAAAGTAIIGGGTTATAAIGGGIASVAVASEVIKENAETIETTKLEDAHGGVPMEEAMAKDSTTNGERAPTDSFEPPKDPFEAFRQCMSDAGITDINEQPDAPSCVAAPRPQKEIQSLPSH